MAESAEIFVGCSNSSEGKCTWAEFNQILGTFDEVIASRPNVKPSLCEGIRELMIGLRSDMCMPCDGFWRSLSKKGIDFWKLRARNMIEEGNGEASVRQMYESVVGGAALEQVGEFCENLGIKPSTVKSIIGLGDSSLNFERPISESDLETVGEKLPIDSLSNGVVLELYFFIEKLGVTSKIQSLLNVLTTLFALSQDLGFSLSLPQVSKSVSTALQLFKKVKKFGVKGKVSQFMVEGFKFPVSKGRPRPTGLGKSMTRKQGSGLGQASCSIQEEVKVTPTPDQKELEDIRHQYQQLSERFEKISTELHQCQTSAAAYKEIATERALLIEQVGQLKRDLEKEQKKTRDYERKLSFATACARNAERRSKRRKGQFLEKSKEVKTLTRQLQEVKSEFRSRLDIMLAKKNDALIKKRKELNTKLQRTKKREQYYRQKYEEVDAREKLSEDKLKEMNATVAEMEDRIESLVERECGKLTTMKKGKYVDGVRMVYQYLMSVNVGRTNCEGIVRSVLKNIAGLEAERLPKETFANQMLFEAKALAQIQLFETVLNDDNITLCSDGTSKKGHHYGAYDVGTSDGHIYTLGLRETIDGTALTTLQVLQEVVQDLLELGLGKDYGLGDFFVRIKNVMSDRHTVQKKFNQLLSDYRGKFLPVVLQEWGKFGETQRSKVAELNEFFCGLHFIVGLAEQASSTLKAWETMIFGDAKVGAASVTGFDCKEESGTERLVRTVCKSVQDRACEKSGKPVQFRAFLSSERNIRNVPLAPFKGNRFNILFHNGAGVFHLHESLRIFFDRHKSDNKLIGAVNADLSVPQFVAGTKALGIIDKVVTGPLWRALEKETHVLNMNQRYSRLLCCFEKWGQDASDLVTGKDILYPDVPVNKDSVYDTLMQNNQYDAMVKQLLEMLCTSFEMLSKRMLADHLDGGKYSDGAVDLVKETQSVPTTNTTVERDFGMLDRLMREKPSASTLALEAMIMYKSNKTAQWTESLAEEERSKYLCLARKSVARQKQRFVERLTTIQEGRERKEMAKKEAIQKREEQDRVRKTLLMRELTAYGGLAESRTSVEEQLRLLQTNAARSKYLETQLKFRRYVLGAKNEGGMFNVSSAGKKKTPDELLQSLLKAIDVGNKEVAETTQSSPTIGLAPEDAVNAFKSSLKEPAAKKMRKDESTQQRPIQQQLENIEHLVGKRIRHNTEEKGEVGWFLGTVLGLKSNKFFIRYDGFSKPYSFSTKEVKEDLECGDLELIQVEPDYLLGKEVKHLWVLDDGKEIWCKGLVLSCETMSGIDTVFEIVYVSEDTEDEDEDDEVFLLPLLQDYQKHELHFT
ncbi:hypothetical protein HOLleu_01057 [Holothuria leucospilota]|uniref:Uncharacterized protein n=1 Tax=Holothuria leucospilota TaxID=206669 RepID=A0A9Q1CNT3_HOLLE|nr:hypothetical protein HOLleu_01057 [Holothuria leucospilota]